MYVIRKFIGLKLINIKMELSNEIELTVWSPGRSRPARAWSRSWSQGSAQLPDHIHTQKTKLRIVQNLLNWSFGNSEFRIHWHKFPVILWHILGWNTTQVWPMDWRTEKVGYTLDLNDWFLWTHAFTFIRMRKREKSHQVRLSRYGQSLSALGPGIPHKPWVRPETLLAVLCPVVTH